MRKIECPNCHIVTTDKDFDNSEEKLSMRMGDDGFNYFECFECNHKWSEAFEGVMEDEDN